jgi:hypothetical protein
LPVLLVLSGSSAAQVVFSQYVEGTGHNKAR